ncbi:MAG TPA: hypothetical protein VNR86_10275 [Sphingomicrobium sp.]|nr:hypothetical protein [Sphingomicrobium sp.]
MRASRFALTVAFTGSLALVCGTVALAAGQVAPGPSQGAVKADTGKRICREVTPTGTRFMKRVCKTPDEWEHDTDTAQRHLDESNRSMRDFQPDRGIGNNPH